MTQILHIIGQQGVGKSTLARDIKAAYEARGVSCENLTELQSGVYEPGRRTNIQQIREHGFVVSYDHVPRRADVVIVEHLDNPYQDQVATGDLLIRLERAP